MLAAMRRLRSLAFSLPLLLLSSELPAHPLAPGLLELHEQAAGEVHVRFRVSRLRPRGSDLTPALPASCPPSSQQRASEDGSAVTFEWTLQCAGESLGGQRVGVDGIGRAKVDVLLRVVLRDDRVISRILNSSEPDLLIPGRQSRARVMRDYTGLGIAHILGGLDHLLFVFGLLILVTGARALIETITAFTLGHSITLSLAALGLANVPSRPVELLIALSVLLLAVEIARPKAAARGRLARRPWLMAASFGLLHGMGFAGALREIGLPQEEIPLALFSFNIGIEIGQLAFVATVLVLRRALRAPLDRAPAWLARVPAYAIGSAAAFWCIERVESFVQG